MWVGGKKNFGWSDNALPGFGKKTVYLIYRGTKRAVLFCRRRGLSRRFVWLAAVCITAGLMCVTQTMAVAAGNKTYDFEGKGTQYNPYLITSYEDICMFRDLVNQGDNLQGVYFKQKANLRFPDGEMWEPIGDVGTGLAFSGYYDGNGYSISNIYCEYTWAGLFSFLDGEVRNLGIESGTFSGYCIGSITSHGTSGAKIINCYNKASVVGNGRVGGIADNFPGTIMFCWNQGAVTGMDESTITAGICSCGGADISYCYALAGDKLTDAVTFFGKIAKSAVLAQADAAQYMELMYEGMWNHYSSNENTLVNRSNTVFMRWEYGTVIYDRSFQPERFAAEKEANKNAFLEVYNSRFEFEGNGTEDDPFQIASYEDLVRLGDCVDVGVTYAGYFFRQTADIKFPSSENWNPIGDLAKNIPFRGTYDGEGHRLYDIYCEDKFAGFFSLLNGEVRNLGIESGCFTGSTVGSITSHGGPSAKIINCYNKADVIGQYRAGGLVDNYPGLILFSWNFGEVSGTTDNTILGGISSYGSADIEYCYTTTGESLGNLQTFNGTVVGSDIVSSADMGEVLAGTYSQYSEYVKNETLKIDDIVFLTFDGDNLVFDTSYVPNEISRLTMLTYLPAVILFGIGVAFCTLAAGILRQQKEKEQQRKAAVSAELKDGREQAKGKVDRASAGRRIAAVMVTLLMIALLFGIVNRTLLNKNGDGITTIQNYYKQPRGKVDVLFAGSSRVGFNIDGEVLWNDFGISAYNLWGSVQPFWNTYYFLEEAFKVTPPKVVVLDVTAAAYNSEFSDNYRQITNTLGIQSLDTKARSVSASCKTEDRLDFVLGFPLYHNRYRELNENDFKHYEWTEGLENDKGFHVLYGFSDAELKNCADAVTYRAINPKEEYYLNLIINLCKEKKVGLVLVKTQTLTRVAEQPFYNTVEWIAESNGIPFINFNFLDDELNFTIQDFYKDGHLNTAGARKNSAYLGQYLTDKFELDDHRGDDDYYSWDLMSCMLQDSYIATVTDSDDYFAELERDKKTVTAIPYKMPDAQSPKYQELQEQLDMIGGSLWDEEDRLYGEDNAESMSFGTNHVKITKNYSQLIICINEKEIKTSDSGLIMLIYDEATDEIVDVSMLVQSKGFAVSHLYH